MMQFYAYQPQLVYTVQPQLVMVPAVTVCNSGLEVDKMRTSSPTSGRPSTDSDSCSDSSSGPSSLSITCSSMDYQPSTSGYSSDMAYCALEKIKKKEKVKQYLKELRSMIPAELSKKRRFGTLSTLQHVLNSMRKLNEEPCKEMTDEETTQTNTVGQDPASTDRKIKLWIAISKKEHKIQELSPIMMQLLCYPKDVLKGRPVTDLMQHKDQVSFNSNLLTEFESEASNAGQHMLKPKRNLYVRIRSFQSMNTNYSVESPTIHLPFEMKASYQSKDEASKDESQNKGPVYLECRPLHTPYQENGRLPETVTFTTRHTRMCHFSYVHSNAILLLGYLPQDINGKSIFEFYHSSDLIKLYEVHQQVLKSKGVSFESPPMRLKAHNGDYVEVRTNWTSFVNPWTKQVDFVIGHHTVIKGPQNVDVFAEPTALKTTLTPTSNEAQQKMHNVIRNLLLKPEQMCAPTTCSPPPRKKRTPEPATDIKEEMQQVKTDSVNLKDASECLKPHAMFEKETKVEKTDSRDISAMYNQLNYSHNIKRYLMSQTVSASARDQSCMDLFYGDPITNAGMTKDIVNLSVPKPPSFGSSTMVRVSEHHEENLPGQLEQEVFLPRWTPPDNAPHVLLTEAALRKHTKLQERLLCEQVGNDKNIFCKSSEIGSHQTNLKRLHSAENSADEGETTPKQTNWAVPSTACGVKTKMYNKSRPAIANHNNIIFPIPNAGNSISSMQWPHYSHPVAAIPAVYQSMPGMLQPFPPYLCMGLNAINASAGPMSHFSDIRQSSSEEGIIHENRMRRLRHNAKKPVNDSFWLKGVQWTEDTKYQFRMPHRPTKTALEADYEFLKNQNTQQLVVAQMNQLLEEMSTTEQMVDEEYSYMFIPGYTDCDNDSDVSLVSENNEDSVLCSNLSRGFNSQLPSHIGRERRQFFKDLKVAKTVQKTQVPSAATDNINMYHQTWQNEHNEQKMYSESLEYNFQRGNMGSSSSDEINDSRKNHSRSSKAITDMTPSDERSTELVVSSMKESSDSGSNQNKDSSADSETDQGCEQTYFHKLFGTLPTKFASRKNKQLLWIDEMNMNRTIRNRFHLKSMGLDHGLKSDMSVLEQSMQSTALKQHVDEAAMSTCNKQGRQNTANTFRKQLNTAVCPEVKIDKSIFQNLFIPMGSYIRQSGPHVIKAGSSANGSVRIPAGSVPDQTETVRILPEPVTDTEAESHHETKTNDLMKFD